MTFHLAAYAGSSVVGGQVLMPVTDMVLPTTSSGFLLPSPLSLIAAAATIGSGGAIARARIRAPSLARVGYPYIRPIGHGETTDPNVMSLLSSPLMFPASENVSVEVVVDVADIHTAVLMWFCERIVPAPPGERFTMRFTAAATAAAAGEAWVPAGTVNFDQSLPPGAYTVVGFEHWSHHAIAARLIFPGSYMRPGTLSVSGSTFPSNSRTDRIFYEGDIGVYGSFNAFAPPLLEVLTTAADASGSEGYLTLIRTGDTLSHSLYPDTSGSGSGSGGARSPLR